MRRWLFKYRLSSLLGAVAVTALLLGGYIAPSLRQRDAVAALRARRVIVRYSCERDSLERFTPGPFASVRDSLGNIIGHDWVSGVAGLDFRLLDDDTTDEDLAAALQFPKLRMLAIYDRDEPDVHLRHIVRLRHLEHLDISSTDITDASLPQLSRLSKLRELLLGRGISDDGIEHIRRLQTLERLYIIPTQITAAGAAELQLALPNCRVVH